MPLFHTEFSQVKLNFWNLCRKSISDIFLRFSMVLFYQQKFRTKHVRWSPNWAYWVSNWANWCSNLISPIKYFLCFTNNCFMKVYNFNSIKTKSILDIERPLLWAKENNFIWRKDWYDMQVRFKRPGPRSVCFIKLVYW